MAYRCNNARSKGQRATMTKRAESKYKINRRLGVNLWGRAKSRSPSANMARPAWPAPQEATDYGTS